MPPQYGFVKTDNKNQRLAVFFFLQANYKMQAVQLQKEIADVKRRVSNAKFRLDNETKVKKKKNENVF